MEPEATPQAGEPQAAAEQDSNAKEESELKRARAEAAKYRTQYSELNAKWKEAEPALAEYQKQQEAQKTEAQKLAERIAALEAESAKKDAELSAVQRKAKATVLATKAGVDTDLLDLLDLSKLDLEDEAATLKTLGKLATARTTAQGASNPARSGAAETDEQRRQEIFGGRRTTLFGG